MNLHHRALILGGAFLLDMLLKDPNYPLHPVRVVGGSIGYAESLFYRRGTRLEGFATYLLVASFWMCLGYVLDKWWVAHLFFLYSFIAPSQLWKEVVSVARCLERGDITGARGRLGMLMTRDTTCLSGEDAVRCALETLAENTSDAFFGPALAYLVGGLPLLFLYKATETGDSMVGYRNERYRHFGFFFAKADDVLNLIPARLCFLFCCLGALVLGLDWRGSLRLVRYAPMRESPNAGWPEAAFAGALGVMLGGVYSYFGREVFKFPIGEDRETPTCIHIYRGVALSAVSCVMFVLSVMIL